MTRVVKIRLKEILKERKIEQKDFASMTGLTTRTVSELCTQKTNRYPKEVIAKIMDTLELTKLDDLLYIEDDPNFKKDKDKAAD
jgi:putative transcriptional regulator